MQNKIALSEEPDNAECIYCSEVILSRAKKCKFCGSFQTWRRHLGIGATLVSLFIGLVAIIGLLNKPLLNVKYWLIPKI